MFNLNSVTTLKTKPVFKIHLQQTYSSNTSHNKILAIANVTDETTVASKMTAATDNTDYISR